MHQLSNFNDNKEMKQEVFEYFEDFFAKRAIEKVFAREDVSHLADAREILEEAMENLDVIFNKKAEPVIHEEAR